MRCYGWARPTANGLQMNAGAMFILNIGIAGLFAVSFAVLALVHREQRAALGFCLSYLVGMFTPLSELLISLTGYSDVLRFLSYASFLGGLLLMPLALARLFGQQPIYRTVLALFAGSLVIRLVIWDGTRNTFSYELLYQLPFAAAAALSCWVASRSAARPQNRAITVAFAVIALHFLLKPLAAVAWGTGASAAAYSDSIYALVSQASTGLLLVAAGLLLLLTVFHRAMEMSQSMSETDQLSGLLNRRGFDRAARAALSRPGRGGMPVAAVMFDIDHFKQINDRYGHAAGDAVIAGFADLLHANMPADSVAGRIGGEEFALLLDRANADAARLQAEAVRLAVEADDGGPNYTVSAGIAEWQPGESLADLLRRADQALYAAKNAGRNRAVVAAANRTLAA